MTLCLGGENHDMQFGKDELAVAIEHGLWRMRHSIIKGALDTPMEKAFAFV